jgi:hypothetical protein
VLIPVTNPMEKDPTPLLKLIMRGILIPAALGVKEYFCLTYAIETFQR